jgi:hypothetical protein
MRPRTIAGIAERTVADASTFDRSVREFLDSWQSMNPSERDNAIRSEPVSIGMVQDAYVAALAEHLALGGKRIVPEWTRGPSRFLREPFFAGGLESLKAILLVESPLAFRRRLIFISADALSRPNRQPV